MQAEQFIAKWTGVQASELATAQTFVIELCELLDLPRPNPAGDGSYTFERPITFQHGDGSTSPGRIDCYRRGAFVLEAKKLKPGAGAQVFDDAMLRARAQAENYARSVPAADGRPPFLIVVDVGNVIELYAEFSRSGATYTPFPDARHHRIPLTSLTSPAVRELLTAVWLKPDSLDPTRVSAQVTRQVAATLAELARSLEADGHRATDVAAFLTRCLFSMFAEDVELLPKAATGDGAFLELLQRHRAQPAALMQMLRALWTDMDRGGFSVVLAQQVLRFNGKLFKSPMADGYVLPLSAAQIDLLIQAARSNWRAVEPAIFGTLLERALDPAERHALGAHYTPRAYVERLVLPTVMEPLRADWSDAQAAAVLLAQQGKLDQAREQVRRFHHKLCTVRVLDPACGSGNFLYVALEHLKRLEAEVLDQLQAFGADTDATRQGALAMEGETVTVQQLLGIELNERAAALAELVLWIGWLQWQIRTRGNQSVAEPVIHDWRNIECRDAVLAWDNLELAHDADGRLLSRWDGKTFKPHPVTGQRVPDETAIVPQWRYIKPRKAVWPQADFVVGNPPFIGNKRMREALGDGYVKALRAVWKDVPDSADFVMYWWANAADLVSRKRLRRFGFITTNSISQTFNRRVVQAAQEQGVALVFAVPDHPWIDSSNGAAVRIGMTVGSRYSGPGRLSVVVSEIAGQYGELEVTLAERVGVVSADLRVGADVAAANELRSNESLSNRGVIPHGRGFMVTPAEALNLGLGTVEGLQRHIRPYRNGRDLAEHPRGVLVIDLHGLSAEQVRSRFPAVYQWLLHHVKPGRDTNPRPRRRDMWWLFAEDQPRMRASIAGLHHYIATCYVAKHRTFQFLNASILPDDGLVAIGLSGALSLGVLSSQIHAQWALAAGGRLGVGNDPRYNKSRCFDPFPFPSDDTGLTPALAERIGTLAESIDAHRKRVQAAHPGVVTLTGLYNVMEALRQGRVLTAKERAIHDAGLVAVLRELHAELDAAVLQAYGWSDLADGLAQGPVTCTLDGEPPEAFEMARAELLIRLVQLNARRAAEEARGRVRWLRPEFQTRAQAATPAPTAAPQDALGLEAPSGPAVAVPAAAQPWPAELPEQVRAVAQVLEGSAGPLALAQIEAAFKGRGPWKKGLPRILQTLEALGRARSDATGAWRAG